MNQDNQTTPEPKGAGGRPLAVTPEVLSKLEEAFLLGCTDEEACLVADISRATLYNYQKDHPEFIERKEELKERPVYIARKSVVDALEKDPKLSLDYLQRKKKGEFAIRVENTGADGAPLNIQIVSYGDNNAAAQLPTKGVPASTPESS